LLIFFYHELYKLEITLKKEKYDFV
jgi:hypothetical protein